LEDHTIILEDHTLFCFLKLYFVAP